MNYFSMPADFKTATIDQYDRLNSKYPGNKVIETYGQATRGNIFSSGRPLTALPAVHLEQLQEYADYSQQKGIGFNYTLNASCLGNIEFTTAGITRLKFFLKDLYDAGIRSLTVTLPSLIEMIQETGYDFEIKASTILQVTNVNRAVLVKNMGVQRIVPDESLNRNFKTLKRIRQVFGDKIEIIINSVCHKDCVNRLFHYNQIAHDSADPSDPSTWDYYSHRCLKRRVEKPGNILRMTWIRPEDLHYYTDIGIRYFKLRGRQSVLKGDPVRALQCYFSRSFAGNLLELLDLFAPASSFTPYVDNKKLEGYLKPFAASPGFCREDCGECRHCDMFAQKAINQNAAEKIARMALEFYDQYDTFTQTVRTTNEHHDNPKLILEKNYWLNRLSGLSAAASLPADHPDHGADQPEWEEVFFDIPASTAAKVIQMGRQSNNRIFPILVTALHALLYRYDYKNTTHIFTWSSTSKEERKEDYLNSYTGTRTKVQRTMKFKDLLVYIEKTIAEADKNSHYPFDKILEAIGIEKENAVSTLSDIGIVLENIHYSLDHLNCNLLFSFNRQGNGINGKLRCNTARYQKETVRRYIRHFKQLLDQAMENPDISLPDLQLMTEEEKQQLLKDFNRTYQPLEPVTLHELFYRQAARTPGRPALHFKNQVISYRELNETTNRLAHTLREKGVTANTVIALLMGRSHRIVIGMLAVLKAGGAYLPIETNTPEQRIKNLLEESQTRFVLTRQEYMHKVPDHVPVIDIMDERSYSPDSSDLDLINTPEDLVNVIFTSGSTGQPKGVMVSHRGLMNYVNWRIHRLEYTPDHVSLQLISYAFDGFAGNVYPELLSGASIVFPDETESVDYLYLKQLIREKKVTHLGVVPAMYKALLLCSQPGELDSLRSVVIAGDKTTKELLNLSKQIIPDVLLVNEYGPTENSVATTAYFGMQPGQRISIGTPVFNNRVYILAEDQSLLPFGAAGELCVSGLSLAKGYLNHPELTAEKFCLRRPGGAFFEKTAPPGRRRQNIYRTGDLARWLPGGNIELLGRIDQQVKINGLRIELGEIENLLLNHKRIGEAAVITRGETDEKKSICAYYVEKQDNHRETTYSNHGGLELWPSMAEFFVYDEMLYFALTNDEPRNELYKVAINRLVKDKIVVDVGTGQDAILARFCIEAGAKKVYAIDIMEQSIKKAQKKVKELGLEDKITIIHGDATKVELPEKADICVSEIVGPIGGSEGAAHILNRVKRLLTDNGRMIPEKSITKIAAVHLPDIIRQNPGFAQLPAAYTEKIFNQLGYKFDLRVLIKNFPKSHILSNHEIFEYLDFNRVMEEESSHEVSLTINKTQTLDGFLLWLNLFTIGDKMIDILDGVYSWQPVFIPVFYPGVRVSEGDIIRAACTRTLCRENRVNPDYNIQGTLVRKGANDIEFEYQLPNFEKGYRKNDFYRELFRDDIINVAHYGNSADDGNHKLTIRELREYMGKYLPGFMVPTHFVKLEEMPLTSNGKIDRRALPEPKRSRKSGVKFQAPGNDLEKKLAQIWTRLMEEDGAELSIYDSLFDTVGNSLLMVKFANAINKQLNTEIKITDLFTNCSIEQIAQFLIKSFCGCYTGPGGRFSRKEPPWPPEAKKQEIKMKVVLIKAPDNYNREYQPIERKCWSVLHLLRYQFQYSGFLSPGEFIEIENIKKYQYGLLSIAASLERAGYHVKYAAPSEPADLGPLLLEGDVFGISSITATFNRAKKIAGHIKKSKPGAKIILGGHHGTHAWREILKANSPFDYIVVGFGEETFIRLLDWLSSNRNEKKPYHVPGIAFKDQSNKICLTGESPIPDINLIPYPSTDKVRGKLIGARIYTTYECPFNCAFCKQRGSFSNHSKNLSILREELISLKELKGTKLVFIGDPVFGMNFQRVVQISNLMNELDLYWQFQTKVDLINEKLLHFLSEDKRFCGLELGIETSDDSLLKKTGKNIIWEQSLSAIRSVIDSGINLLTYWLYGLPGMNKEIAAQDFKIMAELIKKQVLVHLNLFVPYPGTRYYHNRHRNGMKIEVSNWDAYYSGNGPIFSLREPPLPRDELQNLYLNGVNKLYKVAKEILHPETRGLFPNFKGITIYRGLF